MPEITMPRLSDSMEEGTIIRWLVADGTDVARGDEIVEIETDKANMTYESDAAGTFKAAVAEGDARPVGAVIAHVLGDGEEAPSSESASSDGAEAAPPAGPSDPAHPDDSAGGAAEIVSPAPPAGSAAAADAEDSDAPAAPAGGRVKASPLARRLAREQGVDISTLTGSGSGGRIVRADVEAAAAAPTASPTPAAGSPVSPSSPGTGGGGRGRQRKSS